MQRVFRVVETHTLSPSGVKTTSRFNRSVRRYGVLTPILLAEVPDEDGVLGVRIIDGNRRVRAAQAERLPRVPAVVLKATSEKDRARLTLICNYLRSNNFHSESQAILALAQDETDAEQVAGALGLGAVKMRQLFHKIDRMPEPVRRAMYEQRVPVTGAQWVSAWPERLQQQACDLVERRRYVPLKALRELRERYELAHPEEFEPRRSTEVDAETTSSAVTDVWIDMSPVASVPAPDALTGEAQPHGTAAHVAAVSSPRQPVDRPVPAVPESSKPEPERAASHLAGDPHGPKHGIVGTNGETAPEDRRHVENIPAVSVGPAASVVPAMDTAPCGPPRPAVPATSHSPSAGSAIEAAPTVPDQTAAAAGAAAAAVPRADQVAAFVRRLDETLLDLAREARRQGIERPVWIDRTFRAWERAEGA